MFLGAGSVMHGMNDQVDMRRFGGLWSVMKITWITFGLGWLAIIGVPPFSGFWSKDKIIEAAFTGEGWRPWVFGGGRAASAPAITAFYMSRLFFMTFQGKKRWTDDVHPHESPQHHDLPDDRARRRLGRPRPHPRPDRTSSRLARPGLRHREAPEEHPVIAPVVITGVTLLARRRRHRARLGALRARRGPETAPAGSLLTRAARSDLYQDAVNEALFMRPGITSPARSSSSTAHGVDGAATGLGRAHRRDVRTMRGSCRPGIVRSYALTMLVGVVVLLGAVLGDAVMTNVPWLTIVGAIPLVGRRRRRGCSRPGWPRAPSRSRSGSRCSRSSLGIIARWRSPVRTPAGQFQLAEQHAWIPQFGVSYAVGVDGIALALILMSLVLTPICLLAAWRDLPASGERPDRAGARTTSRSCWCSRRSWSACSPRPTCSCSTSSSRRCSSRSTS